MESSNNGEIPLGLQVESLEKLDLTLPCSRNTWKKKKERMRTASDVISRIRWDDKLPSIHFTVVYLDRFIGNVEKPFDDFNWEDDLSAIDDTMELSIPMHRIQSFRYKGHLVWDKATRLDCIFLSTGHKRPTEKNVSIYELMKSIDEAEVETNFEAFVSSSCQDQDSI